MTIGMVKYLSIMILDALATLANFCAADIETLEVLGESVINTKVVSYVY